MHTSGTESCTTGEWTSAVGQGDGGWPINKAVDRLAATRTCRNQCACSHPHPALQAAAGADATVCCRQADVILRHARGTPEQQEQQHHQDIALSPSAAAPFTSGLAHTFPSTFSLLFLTCCYPLCSHRPPDCTDWLDRNTVTAPAPNFMAAVHQTCCNIEQTMQWPTQSFSRSESYICNGY